jgi:hypothetical protein
MRPTNSPRTPRPVTPRHTTPLLTGLLRRPTPTGLPNRSDRRKIYTEAAISLRPGQEHRHRLRVSLTKTKAIDAEFEGGLALDFSPPSSNYENKYPSLIAIGRVSMFVGSRVDARDTFTSEASDSALGSLQGLSSVQPGFKRIPRSRDWMDGWDGRDGRDGRQPRRGRRNSARKVKSKCWARRVVGGFPNYERSPLRQDYERSHLRNWGSERGSGRWEQGGREGSCIQVARVA